MLIETVPRGRNGPDRAYWTRLFTRQVTENLAALSTAELVE
jgi:hypothetical protein